jgi:hypothetical protein
MDAGVDDVLPFLERKQSLVSTTKLAIILSHPTQKDIA